MKKTKLTFQAKESFIFNQTKKSKFKDSDPTVLPTTTILVIPKI
uniref:Uncharacterized protein n=1 Tax=Sphingobacterium sp. (strain 21) TaxID=743722 RepID=F4CBI0_SPHS2